MNSPRIMFLRADHGHPVGCLAISLDGGKVTYQVSTLNPADRFNRSVARQLAIGRMVEKPMTTSVDEKSSLNEVYRAVMQEIANSNEFPTRTVKSARRWLKSEKISE